VALADVNPPKPAPKIKIRFMAVKYDSGSQPQVKGFHCHMNKCKLGYLDGVSHYYIWNVRCKGDLPIVKYQYNRFNSCNNNQH
jgi:hypothetical protein